MLTRTDLIDKRDALQRQLRLHRKNLYHLQEEQAKFGLSVPLHIVNGIDEFEEKIEQAENQLQELEAQLANLPPEPEPPAETTPAVAPETPPFNSEPMISGSPSGAISEQALLPLKEALARRSLVLYIGADLPREATGLPSRTDLARELARRKSLAETLSLAEVAQRVSQAGNRFEFIDFLRNELDTIGRSPQPFHQRLAALVKAHQLELMITTAYDDLLERACQQAGLGLNRVVRGSDVSFINRSRPTLIKLYGDVAQPDTLVVTDQDHTDLLRNRDKEELLDEVRSACRRNTILFLGYNLADSDFRFIFNQIAESRFARTAYAVWPGLPQADVRMWRDRGIIILEADPLLTLAG